MVDAKLSPDQEEVIRTIILFQAKRGYQPSLGELGEALCRHPSTAFNRLRAAEIKGWIKKAGARAYMIPVETYRELGFEPPTNAEIVVDVPAVAEMEVDHG